MFPTDNAICRESGGGGNRTRGSGRTDPAALRDFLRERDGDRCFYCLETFPAYHVDHVRPASRGGSDDPENLVLACGDCNCDKSAWPAWLFAIRRELGLPMWRGKIVHWRFRSALNDPLRPVL